MNFLLFNVHAEVIETLTKIFSLSAFFSYTNLLQVTYLHFLLSNGQIGNAVIMSEEKNLLSLFFFMNC